MILIYIIIGNALMAMDVFFFFHIYNLYFECIKFDKLVQIDNRPNFLRIEHNGVYKLLR